MATTVFPGFGDTGRMTANMDHGNEAGSGRVQFLTEAKGDQPDLFIKQSGQIDQARFTLETPFRVASVSKLMVAELMRRLHAAGRLDADADVSDVLGLSLHHPEFPIEPITLRRLVSHHSGIIDPPVYWMAAPGNIRSLFTDEMWEDGMSPGAGFRYSNLNYGIAATVIEEATGERFDHLFTRWIAEPLGLDIGFNWSGVSAARRATAFPAVRGEPGAWEVQVDGPDTFLASEPAILRDPGFNLDDYVPGTNGTLFSPQGGLRASLSDLITIGKEIILKQPDLWVPRWRASDTGGRGSESELIEGRGSEAGHFIAFGEGVYIYPEGPRPEPGRAWVGHHGEAYGVYCGVWVVPDTGAVFAHANLGSGPGGSPMTGFRPNQTEIASAAFDWAYEMAGDQL
ncbi:MAG: serine hydrolase [Pseudomonadota bacterium]